ncbi:MAG: hypothetical protein LBC43_04890 [Bifidobacteriaceae bacterium]|nr:hypothetical protein [Bifidobacteriaceae bacterium]
MYNQPLWIALAVESNQRSEIALAIRHDAKTASFVYDYAAIENLEKFLSDEGFEGDIYAFNFPAMIDVLKKYGIDQSILDKLEAIIKDPIVKALATDKSWLGTNFELYLENVNFQYIEPLDLSEKAWNTKLIYDCLDQTN